MKRSWFLVLGLVFLAQALFAATWVSTISNVTDSKYGGSYDSLWIDGASNFVAYRDSAVGGRLTIKVSTNFTNWITVGAPGFTPGAANYVTLAYPWVGFQDGARKNTASVYRWFVASNIVTSVITNAYAFVNTNKLVIADNAITNFVPTGDPAITNTNVYNSILAIVNNMTNTYSNINGSYTNILTNIFHGVVTNTNINYQLMFIRPGVITNHNMGIVLITNYTNAGSRTVIVTNTQYVLATTTVSSNLWLPIGTNIGTKGLDDVKMNLAALPAGTNLFIVGADGNYSGRVTASRYTNGMTWSTATNQLSTVFGQYIGICGRNTTNIYVTSMSSTGTIAAWRLTNDVTWVSILNTNTNVGAARAYNIKPAAYLDNLYVLYNQGSASGPLNIIKWAAGAWTKIGTNITAGANYPSLAISTNGVLYVAFSDATNGGKLRVIQYTNSTWTSVGTQPLTTSGVVDIKLNVSTNNNLGVLYGEGGGSLKVKIWK